MQEITKMFKRFILPLFIAVFALTGASSSCYSEPQANKKRVMHTKKYKIPPELLERKTISKKDEDNKNAKNKPQSASTGNIYNTANKEQQKPEDKIWKRYMELAAGTSAPEEKGSAEDASNQAKQHSKSGNKSESEDDAASNGENGGNDDPALGIGSILQNYKNRNKAKMHMRTMTDPNAVREINKGSSEDK